MDHHINLYKMNLITQAMHLAKKIESLLISVDDRLANKSTESI